jgi:hypothetical protein
MVWVPACPSRRHRARPVGRLDGAGRRNLTDARSRLLRSSRYLIHDRDPLFTERFVQIESPVYAIALTWCGAAYQQMIPPTLMVGVVSERERFIEEHGQAEAVETFLWNPAEWQLSGVPELSKASAQMAELANQDIWRNDHVGEVETFFAQLAGDLSNRDLRTPKTDDFVCYASNLDLGDGIDDVESQAPQHQLQLLRERELL